METKTLDPNAAPHNPEFLLKGKALLEEGFNLITKIQEAFPQATRDRANAITNIEQGLLWLRQEMYLCAYEPPEPEPGVIVAPNGRVHSIKKNL